MFASIFSTQYNCTIITQYFLANHSTIRATAEALGYSKSYVHIVLTKFVPIYIPEQTLEVRALLDKNKTERHIRGGEATRLKYKCMKSL